MFLGEYMMAWEKGNPAFDAVSGSKIMGYAVNGINAAIGWTLSYITKELGEAGFGDLKVAGHTVAEIQAAQQEKHRRSMVVLNDFKTETNAPGLFKSVSNGSKKFSVDLEKDKPNVATRPSNEIKGVNTFKL
jgi:hypothetical protein